MPRSLVRITSIRPTSILAAWRSEERRVGKECRSWWAADHLKKNFLHSTLSKVLVGHPDYEVTGGTATYKGKNLFDLEPEERSHEGLFLSFQSPIEIPGVLGCRQ